MAGVDVDAVFPLAFEETTASYTSIWVSAVGAVAATVAAVAAPALAGPAMSAEATTVMAAASAAPPVLRKRTACRRSVTGWAREVEVCPSRSCGDKRQRQAGLAGGDRVLEMGGDRVSCRVHGGIKPSYSKTTRRTTRRERILGANCNPSIGGSAVAPPPPQRVVL